MIKIPDSIKFKFGKLNSTIKQYYPFVYLTYSKDSKYSKCKK